MLHEGWLVVIGSLPSTCEVLSVGPFGHDFPIPDLESVICKPCQPLVVGHHDQRPAFPSHQVTQELHDFLTCAGVKISRRLIRQD